MTITQLTSPRFGAIEAGGTKFVLAVGEANGRLEARTELPTTTPEETLGESVEWLRGQGVLAGIGIGTFGPAQLDHSAANWGHILDTPKPGWSQCDLAGFFAREFAVPIGFDTDVNAAAIAEHRLGAGRGMDDLAYITVGTGVGGGLITGGRIVHGLGHPEMGHHYPRREPKDNDYVGHCPFHGDCLEGLASGPAILARWGKRLSEFPTDHEAHSLVAGYLAQLCHTLFATNAVQCVVMGGGVMKTAGLVEKVDQMARHLGAGYLPGHAMQRVVAPGLGDDAGITGALLLADKALRD